MYLQNGYSNINERVGYRFRIIVALSGFLKTEIADSLSVSLKQLESFEEGNIDKIAAINICYTLRSKGIYCSADWLLDGVGEPPYIMDDFENTFSTTRFFDIPIKNINSQIANFSEGISDDIKKELNFFLNLHKNAIFLFLKKKFLDSDFLEGDVVAGIIENHSIEKGDYVLVNSEEKIFMCKILNISKDAVEFILSNGEIQKSKLKSYAQIMWHRSPSCKIYNF